MLFRIVFRRLLPSWKSVSAIGATQVGATLALLWLPSLNADIIDNGVVHGDITHIWRVGALMLAVTFTQMLLAAIATYLSARLAMELGANLRAEMFKKVQTFGTDEIREFGSPSLITRTTNDVQQVQMITFMTFIIMIMAPIMGVGGVIMAIRQNPTLSLLLAAVVPVLALVVGVIMRLLIPHFRIQQTRLDKVSTVLREQLTGVRVIRAFVRQPFMARRFAQANDDLRAVAMRIGNLFAIMFPAVQLVISASTVAVIWFGGHLIANADMQVGSLFAFLNYLMQILMSVMLAAMMFVMVPRAEVCADRIHAVLSTIAKISPAEVPKPLPTTSLIFELQDVTVRYPHAAACVLDGVSARFDPGTVTGIIGSTGCGKTTLVQTLARQVEVSSGAVEINGINIRDLDLSAVRKRIAVVGQRAYLFSGTVASTVSGIDEPGHEEKERVRTALIAAQAWEFVERGEGGMDGVVEAGGANFSGGQRQRLTIARALYREADLLILDDALSALDYATDARLRKALNCYSEKAAIVLVAQRVATIRHANKILVLDGGKIVGSGSHRELLDTCQTYREIVESQLSAEEAA